MTYRIRVKKRSVWLSLLFLFALGMQLGFLLDFAEAEHRFQKIRHSLEETATWEP